MAICGVVLQNTLQTSLPLEFVEQFTSSGALAYNGVGHVRFLSEPLKSTVEAAYASSLKKVWLVIVVMAAAGFVSSLFMEGLPLSNVLDDKWQMADDAKKGKVGQLEEAKISAQAVE